MNKPGLYSLFSTVLMVLFAVLLICTITVAQTFDVRYSIDPSLNLYVANKIVDGKYVIDWTAEEKGVSEAEMARPPLYDAEGCRVGWKVDGGALQADGINTLVPDETLRECQENRTLAVQTLSVEGEGSLAMVQKLEGNDHLVHRFDEGKLYVPKAYNESEGGAVLAGVKLMAVAEPAKGFFLDQISYEVKLNGDPVTVRWQDSTELNVMDNLSWKVVFNRIAPVYVEYDLSLSPEDSANVYLPQDAVTAGSLEIATVSDSVPLWNPVRTDRCFAGWAQKNSAKFRNGDPLYTVFRIENYGDFSKNIDNPTMLYAIWEDCESPVNGRLVLRNAEENATLVLYQKFGSASLRHEIPAAGIALDSGAYDFYYDAERSGPKYGFVFVERAGYTLACAAVGAVPVTVPLEGNAWHVSADGEGGTDCFFIGPTEKRTYKFVFNENTDGRAKPVWGNAWKRFPEAVFVEDDAGNLGIQVDVAENDDFPTAIYRDGYCVQGYTLDAGGYSKMYTGLNAELLWRMNEYQLDFPVTLYAYWSPCDREVSVMLDDVSASAGKLFLLQDYQLADGSDLTRSFSGERISFSMDAADSVTFDKMSFTSYSSSDSIADTIPYRYCDESLEHCGEYALKDSFVVKNTVWVTPTLLKAFYTFYHDLNMPDEKKAFFVDGWYWNYRNVSYWISSVNRKDYFWSESVLGRSDACFEGWSLDAAGTTVFDAFDIEMVRLLNERESQGLPVDTVFAVWKPKGDDCAPKTFKVIPDAGNSRGSFRLFQQTYWRGQDTVWYDVPEEGLEVPLLEWMYLGAVFEGNGAEIVERVDENGNILSRGERALFFSVQKNQADVRLRAVVPPDEMHFVFNADADGSNRVYYGRRWFSERTYRAPYNNNGFPTSAYRTNLCLEGFAFDPMERNKVYTGISSDFIVDYDAMETKPDTLYAVWERCGNEKVDIVSNNRDVSGWFVLENEGRLLDPIDENGVLRLPVADDLFFTIYFGYDGDFDGLYQVYLLFDDGGSEVLLSGDEYNFTENTTLYADVSVDAIPITLDINTDAPNVFFGKDFGSFKWNAYGHGDSIPMGLYRTDAKLAGWSFDRNATVDEAFRTIDADFKKRYRSYLRNVFLQSNDGSVDPAESYNLYLEMENNFVLYAVWEPVTVATWEVRTDGYDWGALTLYQTVDDRFFAFPVTKEGLAVPAVDDGLRFFAHVVLDSLWNRRGNADTLLFVDRTGRVNAVPSYGIWNMRSSATATVLADFSGYHLSFDVDPGESFFYGNYWAQDSGFAVDGNFLNAPRLPFIYNSEHCLAGWSVKPGGTTFVYLDEFMQEEIDNAYPNLSRARRVGLYPRLSDNVGDCIENMVRINAEQEHGQLFFAENKLGMVKGGQRDDMAERVHLFTGEGTMLIPADFSDRVFFMGAVPDSSYTLDSVEVVRGGEVVMVLLDGGIFPSGLGEVTLRAHFSKKNKTPIEIVERSFGQSGNFVQLKFKASDFEVTRRVRARLQVFDVEADTAVVDSILGDSVAMGFEGDIVLRMDNVGDYRMLLTLGDGVEYDVYRTEFTVQASFVVSKTDNWRMVSLVAVDTSAIDSGDQLFYWWDEGGTGDFWCYRTYARGDSIVPTRGIWYSSAETRPLKLLENVDDSGEDFVWNLDSTNTGWNLVANPRGRSVDLYAGHLGEKRNVDEKPEVTFWRYNPKTAGYEEVDILKPYEAVWAKVSKKVEWAVSAAPVFVVTDSLNQEESLWEKEYGDRVQKQGGDVFPLKALAKASAKNRWTLQAVLSDGNGKQDSWNILGVADVPFEVEEPPASMGDHVSLSIVEGDRGLAKSIKAPKDETEWSMSLSAASDRVGYLSIAGIDGVNAHGYHVYVTVDGKTTEMVDGVPLKVLLKSKAKMAMVRVAASPRVEEKNLLDGLRTARLGDKLQVSFDVSESLAGTKARFDLMDMKGRVVKTVRLKASGGKNALVLDAPKRGLYLICVRAGSEKRAAKVMVK